MSRTQSEPPGVAVAFQLRYRGAIAPAWAAIMQDMALACTQTGTDAEMTVGGVVVDEAALIGLLNLLHGLGCRLVSLEVSARGAQRGARPDTRPGMRCGLQHGVRPPSSPRRCR